MSNITAAPWAAFSSRLCLLKLLLICRGAKAKLSVKISQRYSGFFPSDCGDDAFLPGAVWRILLQGFGSFFWLWSSWEALILTASSAAGGPWADRIFFTEHSRCNNWKFENDKHLLLRYSHRHEPDQDQQTKYWPDCLTNNPSDETFPDQLVPDGPAGLFRWSNRHRRAVFTGD